MTLQCAPFTRAVGLGLNLSHRKLGGPAVCTIHQPSIDIFEAFDDLLLMKVGGHIIYHGPLGTKSVKLVEYFEVRPA